MKVSKKVILLGHYGVGKTSLVKRFVHQIFSNEYQATIGVNIEKKTVIIDKDEITMLIWDIAGESSQAKVPASYKLGAHGIIYVFDLTRPETYCHLSDEINALTKILPHTPIMVIGNKNDLLPEKKNISIFNELPLKPYALCSAKTGENIEQLFIDLARQLL
jgi:small GTP-binding protein